jgi:uncharacterized membrane protein
VSRRGRNPVKRMAGLGAVAVGMTEWFTAIQQAQTNFLLTLMVGALIVVGAWWSVHG